MAAVVRRGVRWTVREERGFALAARQGLRSVMLGQQARVARARTGGSWGFCCSWAGPTASRRATHDDGWRLGLAHGVCGHAMSPACSNSLGAGPGEQQTRQLYQHLSCAHRGPGAATYGARHVGQDTGWSGQRLWTGVLDGDKVLGRLADKSTIFWPMAHRDVTEVQSQPQPSCESAACTLHWTLCAAQETRAPWPGYYLRDGEPRKANAIEALSSSCRLQSGRRSVPSSTVAAVRRVWTRMR